MASDHFVQFEGTMPGKRRIRVRFVDELPPPNTVARGVWLEWLQPLVERPGRWAVVYEAETPKRAGWLVQNLKQRRVAIPSPEHEWSFVSRGPLIYARYDGRKHKRRAQVKSRQ